MNVLLASSEAVPFCKTGGLADVVGTLAPRLARAGHRAVLFLPGYAAVQKAPFARTPVPGSFLVPVGDHEEKASLSKAVVAGVDVYFVENAKYYDRPELYRTRDGDYPDNDERFLFFCRAVIEGAKFVDFKPDVVHVHDWQTALIPVYLRLLHRTDAFFARTATVLTVHNFAYQGFFPKETLFLAGFGWSDFTPAKLEYYGGFNFLKAGIVYSDEVNTVSPGYAKETSTSPDFGRGLEGVLKARGADYGGILNGIDTEQWDPSADAYLSRRYGLRDRAEGKAACRRFLREATGLKELPDVPVAGLVSRLDPQKGIDIVAELLPPLLKEGKLQAVLQGRGEPALEAALAKLAGEHPGMVHYNPAYDEGFAHRLYAGCDVFLMPSRFEPCGLSQMIAMRYGAVPVVVRTGGLADTVRDGENGFVADKPDAAAVGGAIARALEAFAQKKRWEELAAGAMAGDYSWDRSVRDYLALYERAMKKVRG